jgi:hypothetical protein
MTAHTKGCVNNKNNNKNKDCLMGNIDVLALFKYLWAALVPVLIKGWSMIDERFVKTEDRVVEIDKRVSDMSADIKVLAASTDNIKEDVKEIKDLLMKLILEKEGKK